MMVVMVVSRRVGQVTFAVSLRTSCRNLNGLKAIVCYRVDLLQFRGIRTALLRPTLISKVSRQAGSIVRGCQSRAGDPKKGPAAGSAMYCGRGVRSRRGNGRSDRNTGNGWSRKPVSGERLKAHARLTNAPAKSCGELQARCGKPKA